nr:hypothetical protein [Rhodospirillales bacterium]
MTPRIGVSWEDGSGPYYAMKWVEAGGRGNRTTTDIDATLLVDRKASLFLIGTVMDYEVNELSGVGPRRSAGSVDQRVRPAAAPERRAVADPDARARNLDRIVRQ